MKQTKKKAPAKKAPAKKTNKTREQWLEQAMRSLAKDLNKAAAEAGLKCKVPENIRAAVGWPFSSARAYSHGGKILGECWTKDCSGDGTWEIFITPHLDDPVRALDILQHEMIHATVGFDHGHKGDFKTLAVASGLEGKMTATVAGDALKARLEKLAKRLGPLAHAELAPFASRKPGEPKPDPRIDPKTGKPRTSAPPRQTTRMVKAECPDCGMVIRTTRKWLDRTGLPTCACGGKFGEA